jgi:hypothetical protein
MSSEHRRRRRVDAVGGNTAPTPDRLVVVGAGDVGGEVARRWVEAGGLAVGVTATTDRHQALVGVGVEPTVEDPRRVIRPGDAVLLSTPGSRTQAAVATELVGLPVARAVMTGTTGIHGVVRGIVREDTPPGTGERARAAAAAEEAFRQWAPGGVVLRLGGLYRRGRGPLQPLLRRGAPLPGPPDRPLPLIHRDDAVTAILNALGLPEPARIYLAVTPPVPRRDVFYREACARHGLPDPTFAPEGGGPAVTFDVALLRRDLLPAPAHPDWREATEG